MPSALESLVGNMTLRELSERSGRPVGAIVEWALGSGAGRAAAPAKDKGSSTPRPAARAKGVDVRTPTGRAAYDNAVLDVVGGAKSPVSAQAVRAKVGGTPPQARSALNRLIEAGKVGYAGRARATRYFLK